MIIYGEVNDGSHHDKHIAHFCKSFEVGQTSVWNQTKNLFVTTLHLTVTSQRIRGKAINKIPQPTNVRDIWYFLGMVTYLNKYSPRLAKLVDSLRELTKKNAPFVWGPGHTEAFEAIKKEITSTSIQTKLQEITTVCQENQNCIIKADSAFINSNPNLKCYPMMISTWALCNTTSIPLIITNNLGNETCIHEIITIGASEGINSYSCNINKITLTDLQHGMTPRN